MALVYIYLAYHELFAVPRALGSPRPADDKPSARMVLVIGDFGLKVEYVPLRARFLDLAQVVEEARATRFPSDENM
jgi:hypothetical protein